MTQQNPAGMVVEPAPSSGRGITSARWFKAGADIYSGITSWQLWWLLGINDIRHRYRRSVLGQLWITLSMAAFIFAIGFVYSVLFRMDLKDYVPHLAVNMVVWTFIAGVLTEACLVFTQADNFLRQERLPKTVFVMRVIVRHLLILAHNALLIPIVMVLFGTEVSWAILLVPVGLALVTLNLLLASLFLGVICTRFRDMPQIVAALVQIAFFVSPVMWQKAQILHTFPAIVDFNPFAHHLIVVSEPMLGAVPSLYRYLACLGSTLVLTLVALPFFARYRERVVYWL